jgi:hypothetical protein
MWVIRDFVGISFSVYLQDVGLNCGKNNSITPVARAPTEHVGPFSLSRASTRLLLPLFSTSPIHTSDITLAAICIIVFKY